MKIQNNYTSPTFKSKEGLKKVCLETLDEFNREFKGIKSPTKFFQDSENAKCPTKRKLYYELGWIWNEKLKILKDEFNKFLAVKSDSYIANMEKLNELMHKNNVANCGQMNNYYQYMLAKKGVCSELSSIEVFNHEPIYTSDRAVKNHLYISVKESEKDANPLAADAWLGTVEDGEQFEEHIEEYMQLNPKRQYIYIGHPELKGYKEFMPKVQAKGTENG